MNRYCMNRFFLLTACVLLDWSILSAGVSAAQDLPCPPMPDKITQVNRDVRSDVSAGVGSLGKLKAGEVGVKTDVVAKNLFEKYPNTDRIIVVQMMAATYCSLLRDSKAVKDSEKLRLWGEFSDRVFKFENPGYNPTTHQPPKPERKATPDQKSSPASANSGNSKGAEDGGQQGPPSEDGKPIPTAKPEINAQGGSDIHFSKSSLPGGVDLRNCANCSVSDSQTGDIKAGTSTAVQHNWVNGNVKCEEGQNCKTVDVENNRAQNSSLENSGKIGEADVSGNIVRSSDGGRATAVKNNRDGEIQKLSLHNNDVGPAATQPPLTSMKAPETADAIKPRFLGKPKKVFSILTPSEMMHLLAYVEIENKGQPSTISNWRAEFGIGASAKTINGTPITKDQDIRDNSGRIVNSVLGKTDGTPEITSDAALAQSKTAQGWIDFYITDAALISDLRYKTVKMVISCQDYRGTAYVIAQGDHPPIEASDITPP
jgi:hypothetical protein